ncbi:Transmembrane protease serine 9 [Orchesella cincta]|uniref:Transmembrane protease serine 9 n=1 Tax=Orchesella cincta TaxID=48709 RepID=A0A1D2N305_ORCCI|nr:Transmembrane protease serine 9 [Orchesella cincta]
MKYGNSQEITQQPSFKENDDRLRIIGGTLISKEGEIPYQILLEYRGEFTCGGSFISVNGTHFVLTAAHCVKAYKFPSRFTVVAGENDLGTLSGNEQGRTVTKIFVHRRYNYRTFANDIALLAIDKPFEVNDYVSPIPLPKQGQTTTGEVIVSGWGDTTPIGFESRYLKKVTIAVINNLACKIFYASRLHFVTNSMLCAGRLIGFSDSCDGDSGGPLKAVNGGYLAGIVSWGIICAFPLQPGVNTEVSHYVHWIETQALNGQRVQNPSPIKGRDDERLRIIGGTQTTDGEIPYQILLQNRGRYSCGGSFIIVNGVHFVLTAAHCVRDARNPSRYTVVAGENDLATISGHEQRRTVTRVLVHPEYRHRTFENDIALLAIDKPFVINEFVSPIPLPTQGQKTRGEVVASGWGYTLPIGLGSRHLKKVTIAVIENLACKAFYAVQLIYVTDSMLCAGRLIGFSDTCDGDSGGPLKAVDGGYLAGIVSWGTICAFPLQPGVNTLVSDYVNWIEQQVRTI